MNVSKNSIRENVKMRNKSTNSSRSQVGNTVNEAKPNKCPWFKEKQTKKKISELTISWGIDCVALHALQPKKEKEIVVFHLDP